MIRRVMFVSFHFAELAATVAPAIPHHRLLLVLNKFNAARELPSGAQVPGIRLPIVGPKRPHLFVWSFLRFAFAYLVWRPHIVHFQEFPTGLSLMCWHLSRFSKRVLTIHDVEPHPGRDSQMSRRNLGMRLTMRGQADRVIVHGEALLDAATRKGGVRRERARVIPHVAFRTPLEPRRSDETALSVLFFGRMEAYKGLEVLVQALKLPEMSELLSVRIAGEGPELERLMPTLATLSNVVVRQGRVEPDEITVLMQNADVLVLPYIEASQSGVAAMALGLGRPVIASNVGAIPEMLSNGINGLLVEPGDAHALGRALELLARDRNMLRELTNGAAVTARGPISAQSVGSATARLYEGLF